MAQFPISLSGFTLFCWFGLLLSTRFNSSADSEKRTILSLNSYHDGYQWSDSILEGIRRELEASPYAIELQVECMDATKYHAPPSSSMIEITRETFTTPGSSQAGLDAAAERINTGVVSGIGMTMSTAARMKSQACRPGAAAWTAP